MTALEKELESLQQVLEGKGTNEVAIAQVLVLAMIAETLDGILEELRSRGR